MSLDALRGFDVCWILVLGSAVIAVLKRFLPGSKFTEVMVDQLEHADWASFHFEDLIFPLFLFISGVSMSLAVPKRVAEGRHQILTKAYAPHRMPEWPGAFVFNTLEHSITSWHVAIVGRQSFAMTMTGGPFWRHSAKRDGRRCDSDQFTDLAGDGSWLMAIMSSGRILARSRRHSGGRLNG